MRKHLSRLVLVAPFFLAGCPASAPVAPETPAAPPPRGDALRAAVIGHWAGTADDGSDTTESVDVTLSQDGGFQISAGMVAEANRWLVRDDLVILLPDPDSEASDGICFRPSLVAAARVEGSWAYASGRGQPADVACKDQWFRVTLDRR